MYLKHRCRDERKEAGYDYLFEFSHVSKEKPEISETLVLLVVSLVT